MSFGSRQPKGASGAVLYREQLMSSFKERTEFEEKKLLSALSLFCFSLNFNYDRCGSKRIKVILKTPRKADNLLKKKYIY